MKTTRKIRRWIDRTEVKLINKSLGLYLLFVFTIMILLSPFYILSGGAFRHSGCPI